VRARGSREVALARRGDAGTNPALEKNRADALPFQRISKGTRDAPCRFISKIATSKP
jgi:hypothetical protein